MYILLLWMIKRKSNETKCFSIDHPVTKYLTGDNFETEQRQSPAEENGASAAVKRKASDKASNIDKNCFDCSTGNCLTMTGNLTMHLRWWRWEWWWMLCCALSSYLSWNIRLAHKCNAGISFTHIINRREQCSYFEQFRKKKTDLTHQFECHQT